MESVHDAKRLSDLQALPLGRKVQITQTRIIEYLSWCKRNGYNPVVSFSGGKDSTVLLHIARMIDSNIKAVFSNTGLEYPEIQRFVKRTENVDIVRPDMSFPEVITTYGYPVISKEVSEAIHYARKIRMDLKTVPRKRRELNGPRPQNDSMRRQMLMGTFHEGGVSETDGKLSAFNKAKWLPVVQLPFKVSHYCCQTMKKSPLHKYQLAAHAVPILATMAAESRVRKQAWVRKGCNAFDGAKSSSQPMSFWTEQDVLEYIQREFGNRAGVWADCRERMRGAALYRMPPNRLYFLRIRRTPGEARKRKIYPPG